MSTSTYPVSDLDLKKLCGSDWILDTDERGPN
jgi:hypothetical protein